MNTSTFHVSGMTCEHCVRAVQQEIGSLPGVEKVEITLVPDGVSTAQVTFSGPTPLDYSAVAAAVDEAGYVLVED